MTSCTCEYSIPAKSCMCDIVYVHVVGMCVGRGRGRGGMARLLQILYLNVSCQMYGTCTLRFVISADFCKLSLMTGTVFSKIFSVHCNTCITFK